MNGRGHAGFVLSGRSFGREKKTCGFFFFDLFFKYFCGLFCEQGASLHYSNWITAVLQLTGITQTQQQQTHKQTIKQNKQTNKQTNKNIERWWFQNSSFVCFWFVVVHNAASQGTVVVLLCLLCLLCALLFWVSFLFSFSFMLNITVVCCDYWVLWLLFGCCDQFLSLTLRQDVYSASLYLLFGNNI